MFKRSLHPYILYLFVIINDKSIIIINNRHNAIINKSMVHRPPRTSAEVFILVDNTYI